jgi:RNA polymerase sigma-70 factor (ECF subfamily)
MVRKKGARLDQVERLYRERYAYFVRVAQAVVGGETAAHDAVQDGFAQAVRKLGSFRGDGPLEAWLWRLVLNAALAIRRRSGSFDPFELAPEPAASDAREGDEQIRAWVAELPERQRLAVFLRYYADLDYKAIAEALGIEVGTVSATLNAAHSALRRSASASEEVWR